MEYTLPEKACTIDIKDRDQDKEKWVKYNFTFMPSFVYNPDSFKHQ